MSSKQAFKSVFPKYLAAFSDIASGILGVRVAVGEPLVEVIKREQISSHAPEPGVIIATTIKEPNPGLVLNYFVESLGSYLPERIINPAATAPPKKFSELHRSALMEMMAQVWIGVGPLFANFFQKRFAPGESVVSTAVLSDYVNSLPAFTGIDDFVIVRSVVAVEGGFEGEFAQLYPVTFWAGAPKEKAKPKKEAPVSLAQMPIEHVEAAAVPVKTKGPIIRATEKPIRTALRERNISALMDVPMEITAEIGHTRMKVGEILKMRPGTVVGLEREAWQPIDLLVGDRVIAQGEIVVIAESHFGIRVTKILSPTDRLSKLD